jgi:hypothetical protein
VQLEHLEIDECYQFLFEELDTPSLTSLHLVGNGYNGTFLEPFLRFLRVSPFPQVQTLSLDRFRIYWRDVYDLVIMLPGVRHLHLPEISAFRHAAIYQALTGHPHWWPRLDTITTVGAHRNPLMNLLHAVHSGHPCRGLNLREVSSIG